jgi:hypothetical protein
MPSRRCAAGTRSPAAGTTRARLAGSKACACLCVADAAVWRASGRWRCWIGRDGRRGSPRAEASCGQRPEFLADPVLRVDLAGLLPKGVRIGVHHAPAGVGECLAAPANCEAPNLRLRRWLGCRCRRQPGGIKGAPARRRPSRGDRLSTKSVTSGHPLPEVTLKKPPTFTWPVMKCHEMGESDRALGNGRGKDRICDAPPGVPAWRQGGSPPRRVASIPAPSSPTWSGTCI